jgi:diguanylate cyclase (GGDEF)-like protein/PAS domain S-box-containing protein
LNNLYKNILDNVPSMIGYCDRYLIYHYANKAYLDWFSLSPEQILGKHIREVIGEERYVLNLPYIQGVLNGERQQFERSLPLLNGNGMRHSIAFYIPDFVEGEVIGFFVQVSDITLQKNTEALISSEERFRLLVEQASDGIFVADAHGNYIDVNTAGCELLGFTRQELLSLNIADVIDPTEIPRIPAEVARFANGQVAVSAWHFLRKDGSIFIGEVRGRQLADGRLQGILIDITERVKAEEELIAREERFQALFDRASEGISIISTRGELIALNNAFAQMRGYTPQAMKKMNLRDLDTPESRSKIPERMQRLIAEGSLTFEVEHYHKDGHVIPFEVSASMIILNGKPIIQSFTRDISERKIAEKLLRESEERYRALVDHAPEAIAVFDVELDRFVDANTNAEKMFGCSRDELLNSNPLDFYAKVQKGDNTVSQIFMERNLRILAGEQLVIEREFQSKDGKVTLCEIRLSRLPTDTRKLIRASMTDITARKGVEQVLQDQQARLTGLIEAAMDAIVSTDENQIITLFNLGAEKMFGYTAKDMIGKHLDLLIPARYLSTHIKHVDEFGKTGVSTRTMNKLGQSFGLRANGEEFPFEASISRVMVSGKPMLTAIMRDITERKQIESDLHLAAAAFDTQEGIMITDAKSVILRVNHAFCEITGYSAEEAIGQTPSLLKSGRHNADFYSAMWKTIHETGKWSGEVWDRRKNGEIYPKWLTITAVKDAHGTLTHYVGSHLDITQSKADEDQIQMLAFYDPLTQLPNRRLLQDRLQHAITSSDRTRNRGALMFIDLDNFKIINDTRGHVAGDQLLKQVAQRLIDCVREGDTVARIGGDEFVLMLEDLDREHLEAATQAEAIGEKILLQLSLPYQLGEFEVYNTTSIGICLFHDQEQDFENLLQQADIAMYQAKRAGRNTLRFFDPKMQVFIKERAELEKDLRNAIENKQFQLFYQVQAYSSHQPFGAEALIRWIHPERGMVSPAQFIPLAEENGLILPIGAWVMETACKQLKAWEKCEMTRNLILSVNVSAKQFHQADFVGKVQSLVLKYAINTNLLKLELTDSMLVENIEETIAKMSALRKIGVRLSLDDFGTGYSSLQYLKRLPLNQLKIDQSFVRDIANDENDQAIAKTIITMALGLRLDVIAEGVETETQLDFLAQRGCLKFQGYYLGKPVPIDQFEASLNFPKHEIC